MTAVATQFNGHIQGGHRRLTF